MNSYSLTIGKKHSGHNQNSPQPVPRARIRRLITQARERPSRNGAIDPGKRCTLTVDCQRFGKMAMFGGALTSDIVCFADSGQTD